MKSLFIVIFIGLFVVVSCKSTDKNINGPDSKFIVKTVKRDSVSDKEMTLVFDASTGQVNGMGVCNSYSSTFVVSGDNIKFSPAMATKMMCPEGTNTEYNFFQALINTVSYKMKRGELTLFNEAEEPLLTAKKRLKHEKYSRNTTRDCRRI